LAYFKEVTGRLTYSEKDSETPESIDLSKLRALDGVRDFPARVKCATLAWHAFNAAIQQHSVPASTE
jgi:nitrogen fixation NifU-like protein